MGKIKKWHSPRPLSRGLPAIRKIIADHQQMQVQVRQVDS
jgi:hypothetical protein